MALGVRRRRRHRLSDRGYEQASEILGADFSGTLERDGWAPYRRFERANHQSCLAHLLRRSAEMIADSVAGQARIPHALRRLLLEALSVRERYRGVLAGTGEVIEGSAVEIEALSSAATAESVPVSPAPANPALAGELAALEGGSTPCFGAAPRTAPTRGCCATSRPSAMPCSHSSPAPASRRPTGAPSRRSARRW